MMPAERRGRIVSAIMTERGRQIRKWGHQSHPGDHWMTILTEELGEVAQEVIEVPAIPDRVECLKTELVQVAAVAMAWLEDLMEQETRDDPAD